MARGELSAAVKAALDEHGEDWPKGLIKEIADRFGSTPASVRVAKSRLWGKRKQELIDEVDTAPPATPVQPEPLPTTEPTEPPAAEESQQKRDRTALTDEEAQALKSKRALDDKRLAGIQRIRHEDDLPEGFRHWGQHAHKLIPSDAIPWFCASGRTEIQLNPEVAPIDEDGRPMKYIFRRGCGGLVGVLPGSEKTVLDLSVPLVIVEGTYQGRAVATALEGSESKLAIVQVSGCDGWMTGGAPTPEFNHIPLRGREVFFLPDADVRTNRGVYDAAKFLRENLLDEYLARDVRIIHLPGRGNDGADDILSRHDQAHNLEMVQQWVEKARGAEGKLGKQPRKRRRQSGFFTDEGNFQPVKFWEYLQQQHHTALNGDKAIAVYENGVYLNSDSRRWNRAVESALGDNFVPQYLNTVSEIAHSSLKVNGKEVPTFLKEPLLNLKNGLLDLRTGELREHTPEVVTTTQLPIEWDPTATCPTWERLVSSAVPGQLERLEDVMSQALDWTRSPTKILLLYGASRAGKGLILRVLEQLMGRGNYSAVTLHQLAENRFMVAELYGKRANIAGELKPDEVKDISAVKMLTGEDPIQADKKYGKTFTFYSYAFLAFSCNKLPPINETTRAFTSRVAPFRFTVGHDGREDLSLAGKLSAELPGILVRLVEAWRRRQERGTFMPVDPATRAHFDENIDHVARFLALRTHPVDRPADGMKRSDLFPLWMDWCMEQNLTYVGKATTKQTFFEKVRNNGVKEGKDRRGTWRWALMANKGGEDDYGDGGVNPGGPLAPTDQKGSDGNPDVPLTEEKAGSGAKPASAESCAVTGEVAEGRQRRQKPEKNSAAGETTEIDNSSKLNERYGQGGETLPSLPSFLPTAPEPFTGDCPDGIVYVLNPIDLPDLDALPKAVGFDLETFNRRTDQWRHVANLFPQLGGEIRLAQVCDGQTTWVIDVALMGQPAVDWLKELARDKERTLVGHNLLFEAQFLLANGIRPLCRWWDTQLASQVIGELPGFHPLKDVAKHYINQDLDKTEQTSNWGGALTVSQLEYAALDAQIVLPLGRELHRHLQRTGQVNTHRLDCQMINPCADSQIRGLHVKQEVLQPIKKQATADRAQKVKELHQLLGLPDRTENGTEPYRNPAMLVPAMSAHLGVELTERKLNRETKEWEDRPSCSASALEPYEGAAAVDLLTDIRDLDCTLKEIKWLQRDAEISSGRIHPSYSILGAETGRTTTKAQLGQSSKLRNVPSDTAVYKSGKRKGQPRDEKLPQWGFNTQGLTGRTKAALGTGSDDTVLLDVDWTSQEIRLQASPRLYNDEGQRKIVFEGLDPHCHIASQVCGREITKDDSERNSIGKPANFSLAYGCGAQSLERRMKAVRGADYKPGEGQRAFDAWHRFHPQCSQQMARYRGRDVMECRSVSGRRIRNTGKTAGADGLVRAFPLSPQKGVNFPVQSSGRDLLADALGDLWPALDQFPGAHVVGLIHDEVLLEVPRAQVEEIQKVVVEAMTSERLREAYLGDVPLDVDAAVADNWGDAH